MFRWATRADSQVTKIAAKVYFINRMSAPVSNQTEAAPARVVVIEDQRELREGLQTLLNFTPNFRCVKSFGSMESALENIAAVETDLILTDIGLPRMNGIEEARS